MTSVEEPLRAAIKSLRSNKMRSTLTALGIVIGVSAVILVVSLVGGLERSIMRQIEKAGSQTLYVRPIQPGELPPEVFAKLRTTDLTLMHLRALERALPEITQVTPLFAAEAILKCNGHQTDCRMVMTDGTFVEQNALEMALGRNFVPADLRLGSKVVIVGPKVLERLAIRGNPIGTWIHARDLSLEIIGVLKEQGSSLGQDPDSNITIPLTTGMNLLTDAQRRQLIFQARLDARTRPEDGVDRVKEALRRIQGLKSDEREGFEVSSARQIASMVSSISGFISMITGGMVSIALLVGGIGIMNIMMVSVTERTREIGVRKAVGAKRRDILLQFLIEAALLAVLGGALGIVLGWMAGAALTRALFGLTGRVPLWAIISAFAVPAFIGIIFGLYPAARASRLDPIEALRYE